MSLDEGYHLFPQYGEGKEADYKKQRYDSDGKRDCNEETTATPKYSFDSRRKGAVSGEEM
jgi:hypothetical protein